MVGELTSGTVLQTFAAPPGFRLVHVAITDDSRQVMMSCRSRDSLAFLAWDVGTGRLLRQYSLPTDQGFTLAVSPDGTRLLTGTTRGVATLRDAATGIPVATLTPPDDRGTVAAGAFSADGTRILTGSYTGKAYLWDATASGSPGPVRIFRAEKGWVTAVAFSPDATRVLTGGMSTDARLWDASNGCEIHTLSGHEARINSLAFSRDGKTILTASGGQTGDQMVKLWDAESGRALSTIERHTGTLQQALFTPDGKGVVTLGGSGGTKLWNAATGKPTRSLPSDIQAAVPLADRQSMLLVRRDGTGQLWSGSMSKRLGELKIPEWSSSSAVSPDGGTLLTAKDGWRMAPDSLYFRDPTDGRLLNTISDEDLNWVRAVAFTPDGKTAITASTVPTGAVGSVIMWDPLTRSRIRSFPLESGAEEAALSPDGTRLAVSCHDGTLLVMDLATGRVLRTLSTSGPSGSDVVFSPEGAQLLSVDSDRTTAILWDVETGEVLQMFGGHTSNISSVAFSPDGTRALTASRDGTWRIWPLSGPE